ncbi:Rha family transcriptional regulator [Burkholderia cepacia]|uniref:Rha family transcriptional regulator n=1 Tax=Burkholderia cepacia TaxID=292 RepID=UPI002655C697|nr:phage antirepressor KilAC domain-containing protein [Burkholderia cepacia]MDN7858328.1 Rha family transcriptional regulator [Burkholderia cepacia]
MNFDTEQTLTMSSREIADLVEVRHPDVMRSIERLMQKGAIGGYTPTPHTHPQNRQLYDEYHVGKRDSYVIVAQLSPEFTARLVDRWQELEAQALTPAFSIPRTLGEALRLAADLEEQRAALVLDNEAKAKLIEQQQPHVEHSQALLATDEVLDMATMAQKLTQAGYNIGRNRLFVLLREDKILKADGTPYRDYASWFYLATRVYTDENGTEHASHTVRVTAQGEAALQRKYAPKRTAFIAKANPPKRGLFKPRVSTDESRTIAN